MMTRTMAALMVLSLAGCEASAQPPRLTSEKLEILAGESPLQAAGRLARQLQPQLAKQVNESETIAFGVDQIGPNGDRLMVAALTPERGAFAIISLDESPRADGNVPVCWFELVWPEADAERSAAGMPWAMRSFPDPGCRTVDHGPTDWERKSAAVRRTVTAQRARTTIVSADENSDLGFPSDLRAAMQTALRPGERIERIAPLPRVYDPRAVGWTSSGRVLLAIPGDGFFDVCVVESTGWTDLAIARSPVAQELVRSCYPLFAEVNEARMKRMEKSLQQHPIKIKPVR